MYVEFDSLVYPTCSVFFASTSLTERFAHPRMLGESVSTAVRGRR